MEIPIDEVEIETDEGMILNLVGFGLRKTKFVLARATASLGEFHFVVA